MKHEIIYALCDPITREVKYVGRTRKGFVERLEHHLSAARRGVTRPVYVWIRSLHPAVPIIIILERVENVWLSSAERSAAASCETKWMKRHRRTICNAIDTSSRAYRRLVNQSR